MKIWLMRGLLVLYAASITAGFVACMGGEGGQGGGCGQSAPPTKCGAGTKKVKSGSGYECVPNQ